MTGYSRFTLYPHPPRVSRDFNALIMHIPCYIKWLRYFLKVNPFSTVECQHQCQKEKDIQCNVPQTYCVVQGAEFMFSWQFQLNGGTGTHTPNHHHHHNHTLNSRLSTLGANSTSSPQLKYVTHAFRRKRKFTLKCCNGLNVVPIGHPDKIGCSNYVSGFKETPKLIPLRIGKLFIPD